MNTKVSLSALTLDGSYSSIFKNHGSEKRGRELIKFGTAPRFRVTTIKASKREPSGRHLRKYSHQNSKEILVNIYFLSLFRI